MSITFDSLIAKSIALDHCWFSINKLKAEEEETMSEKQMKSRMNSGENIFRKHTSWMQH